MFGMVDDDPPGSSKEADSALAVARERVRGLEAQVELLQGQLEMERQRNCELVNELKAAQTSTAQERNGPWWRFWQRHLRRSVNGPVIPLVI